MSAWTESLQPGDSVRVDRDTRTVAKVTKTVIILDDGSRWRREDGRQSRDHHFSVSYLRDPEEVERHELSQSVYMAVYLNCHSCNDGKHRISLPVLRQLAELLKPYTETKP